jgi:hypothetical protein
MAVHAQAKLAQTGFQFLSVGADARATAMGGAMTTMDWGSGALFFNPAGMAQMPTSFDLAASQNRWIADISHNAFSMAISPSRGGFGVVGITLFSVDYGEVEGTMVWENEQGYIETESFSPAAIAIGIGYARAISDRFSIGGHIKYVSQYLGDSVIPEDDLSKTTKNIAFATAMDFGTLFRTGFRSVIFGMSVRNFSNEIRYESENFQLPLTFRIGLAANLFELANISFNSHILNVHVDASHPRAFGEQLNIGVEYSLLNTFYLRGGYLSNYDERDRSFGFGLRLLGLHFDYAFTPFGVFDRVLL